MFAGGDAREARRALGAAASFVVADVLADRGARAGTFGLENALATRVWSAAKTGTSKDMRDNWCIGFTARYTVGVWVGNFSGAPMHDVSGVTGAAPVWRDVVHWLHRTEGSSPPPPPPGLVRAEVAFDPPVEAPRAEWFVAGTAMQAVRAAAHGDAQAAPTPRIRLPAADTVVALDPDIPARLQRVAFVAAPERPDLRWRLDDGELPERGGRALWRPVPGRHTLVLADGAGRELSRVTFDVRGGWLAGPERTAATGR